MAKRPLAFICFLAVLALGVLLRGALPQAADETLQGSGGGPPQSSNGRGPQAPADAPEQSSAGGPAQPSAGGQGQSAAGAPAQPPGQGSRIPPGLQDRAARDGRVRVIVRLRLATGPHVPEGNLPAAARLAQRSAIGAAAARVLSGLPPGSFTVHRQFTTVGYVTLEVTAPGLAALARHVDVDAILEDALIRPTQSDNVSLVQGDQVWEAGYDGTGTMIAVLDSGVESTHPFLAGKVDEEACYSSNVPGTSQSFCPNGQSEQIGPGSAPPCPLTDCSHGTHVAGIAAGVELSGEPPLSGVAKGAQLMAVQVFSEIVDPSFCPNGVTPCLGAYESDIMAGLERVSTLASQHTFAAVNMSLGGGLFSAPCDDDPIKPSIDNLRSLGIASVVSAGNSFSGSSLSSPACISSAVSVGSSGPTDQVSFFSNIASFLTVLAPGESIVSSVPGGGYAANSGTSMAAPHVAGALALLKHAVPALSVDGAVTALRQTGLPITDTRLIFGQGVTTPRIRVFQALAALAPVSNPLPVLTALSPSSAVAGASALTLTVTGSGFNAFSAVMWDGTTRPTTVVDTHTLKAAIPATDLATARTVQVTVFAPVPGGGTSSSLSFTIGSPSDLVISTVSAPATAGAGTTITVTSTTKNQGSSSADVSVTGFFLSPNSTLDAADVRLGSTSVPALAAGTTNSASTTLTIPTGTATGTYYIIVKADADGTVPETQENNNTRASSAIRIGPDVAVSALTASPVAVAAGGVITVTDTTVNQGGGNATASTTGFYLSANSSLDASDVRIGGRAVPELTAGAASSISSSLTIPTSMAGTYYVIAKADDSSAVAETQETNNTKLGPSIKIGPDLVVSSLTGPAAAGPGGTIVVTDTTVNQGAGGAPPSNTAFYLSPNTTVDAGDPLLGQRTAPALNAGIGSTVSTSLTIPAGTASGAYYIVAVADASQAVAESTETNNTRSLLIRIGADLAVSSVSASATAVGAGSTLTVTDTTTNQGTAASPGSSTGFYLSVNALLSAADPLLGQRAVPSLDAGVGSTASTSLTIPAGTATGAYFLTAVADVNKAIAESNETNNNRNLILYVGPDLIISGLSGPASAVAGSTVTITDTTKNQRGGSGGPSTTKIYLSTSATVNANAILIASRTVPALTGGEVNAASSTVTIPVGYGAGTYYFVAVADADNVVVETLESNNTKFAAVKVTAP